MFLDLLKILGVYFLILVITSIHFLCTYSKYVFIIFNQLYGVYENLYVGISEIYCFFHFWTRPKILSFLAPNSSHFFIMVPVTSRFYRKNDIYKMHCNSQNHPNAHKDIKTHKIINKNNYLVILVFPEDSSYWNCFNLIRIISKSLKCQF